MLARLLERWFDPPPQAAQKRIAAASIGQIDAWFDDAFEARSLDDLTGRSEIF